VIGAPQGRSGKTTVALGLCAALAGRGLAVQPFKKGPDYIDPSWLTEAAGRPCRSLDPFFCGDDAALAAAFARGAAGADICILEGNHGLYDGVAVGQGSEVRGGDAASDVMLSGFTSRGALRRDPSEASLSRNRDSSLDSRRDVLWPVGPLRVTAEGAPSADDAFGSTAAVARALAAPILLVVNTARMGRSVAALVHGYQTFEPDTPIAGVILNNVARGRHEDKLRAAVERHCGLPVVGALPRDEALSIPDRHLGLIPRGEDAGLLPALAACRQAAERHFDLDAILAIARAAPPIPNTQYPIPETKSEQQKARTSIALFRDRAFTFYYPENLEALEAAGAELVFVDASRDAALPPVDGLVIGGGFPEMFMAELAANVSLRRSVRAAAEAGLPIYAECGGLMYLAQRILWGGRSAEMAGVLPCDVEMTTKPQGHGYVEAVVDGPNPFFPVGTVLRGHEFHNSRLIPHVPGACEAPGTSRAVLPHVPGASVGLPTAYRLTRGRGLGDGRDGLVWRNVLASYTHLHVAGAAGWAELLLQQARRHRLDPGEHR
jgi:cobyrinic acid a,c-diamide synthase